MNRVLFQHKYIALAPSPDKILDIGSGGAWINMPPEVMHLDLDDWSKVHKNFIQADAHNLNMIPDRAYHTVILGDVVEHLYDPSTALAEAARVCSDTLVMTIFEEWRLSGPGQHIQEARDWDAAETIKNGFEGQDDYQAKTCPDRVGVDDVKTPHLLHINQFTDEMVMDLVISLYLKGFGLAEYLKEPAGVYEDHTMYNWLIALRRVSNGT